MVVACTGAQALSRVLRPLLYAALIVVAARDICAQDTSRTRTIRAADRRALAAALVTQSKLDEWIARRFRGAQLLPDSNANAGASGPQTSVPRIEGPAIADVKDTLVALHFNATRWRSTLEVGTLATLADPTGVVSKLQGRVTARRAFRAPRRPGASISDTTQWRMGWAYLVAIPVRAANPVAAGFEGWLVVEPPPRTKPGVPAAPRTRADSME